MSSFDRLGASWCGGVSRVPSQMKLYASLNLLFGKWQYNHLQGISLLKDALKH